MAVEEALAGLGPPAALQAALLAGPLPSGGTKAAADVPLAPRRRRGGKGGMAHSDSAFLQECDCRGVKGACPPPAAVGLVSWCPYYAVAADGPPRLYRWHEAPAVLRFNPFIKSGYRAGLSTRQCCASLLQLHNESGNIWSHLVPALLMLALVLGGQLQAWHGSAAAYWANVGSIFACFLGSVVYHCFQAHHHCHDRLLKLDVCGILLVLVGGGHMVLWWGFACFPAARLAFVTAYYTCGVVSIWAALRAQTAVGRGLPMLALLLVRLAAFGARLVLEGWAGTPALHHYFAMELFSLAGGALNVLRLPERWLQPEDPKQPAPLDLFLNSHQIMHVLVALAMWQLHLGADADHRRFSALLDGSLSCPGLVVAASLS